MSNQLQIVGCPHCGGTSGFTWKDYGITHEKIQVWGGSIEQREVVDMVYTRRAPVWARCIDCKKRVKIDKSEAGAP